MTQKRFIAFRVHITFDSATNFESLEISANINSIQNSRSFALRYIDGLDFRA